MTVIQGEGEEREKKNPGTWSYRLFELLSRSSLLQILAKLSNHRLPAQVLEL